MNSLVTYSDFDALAKTDADFVKFTELLRDNALQALQDNNDIAGLVDTRNQASVLGAYLAKKIQARDAKLEAQNNIAEVRIRYEREVGVLIEKLQASGELNSRSNNNGTFHGCTPEEHPLNEPMKLADVGISRKQSSSWQTLADIPEDIFEEVIAEAKENAEEITTTDTIKRAKKRSQEKKSIDARKTIIKTSDDTHNIITGDLTLLCNALEDNSVDLFFTDPPYHNDKVYLFEELAKLAARKLKPGGVLLTYSGQMHLLDVMNRINAHIPYWWMFAIRHTGGSLTVWNRHVLNFWKPVIAFAKPFENGKLPTSEEWIMDFQDGGGRDKDFHQWGQDASEATYWIEKLTEPNALVCDPFVGGGSIPVACKLIGRRWIGTELLDEQAQIARNRLAEIK